MVMPNVSGENRAPSANQMGAELTGIPTAEPFKEPAGQGMGGFPNPSMNAQTGIPMQNIVQPLAGGMPTQPSLMDMLSPLQESLTSPDDEAERASGQQAIMDSLTSAFVEMLLSE